MQITTRNEKEAFGNSMSNEPEGKVIRNQVLAKRILEVGGKDVWMFAIKKNRDDPKRSCFVFRNDEKFQEVFAKVLEERNQREHVDNSEVDDLKNQIEELKKIVANMNNKEG